VFYFTFMSKPKKLKKSEKEKIPNQEEVWNGIVGKWKDFRDKPLRCVNEFLYGKKGKILDLGCGTGRNMVEKKGIEWYGVDFSQKMVDAVKKRTGNENIQKFQAWELPFPENFFDYALYVATLHCIPEENKRKKSLEELKRVLKKNGRALITVWDKNVDKLKDKGDEIIMPWKFKNEKGEIVSEYQRYYKLYDNEEILSLLKKYFKIVKVYSKSEETRFERRNLIIEVQN